LAGDGSVLLPWLGGASFAGRLARIRFGGGWSAAACLSPGALNGATRFGGGDVPVAIAPGEIVTLNGFEIGPDAGVSYQADAQGAPPRELAGVQVLFDGQPAPVLYVQWRQINAAAPVELRGQTQTTITVVYNQVTVGSIQAAVAEDGVPGIFRLQPDVSSQAMAVNPDGTMNGPSNPADRGSTVSLLGTGFGPTDPPCATGGSTYRVQRTWLPVGVWSSSIVSLPVFLRFPRWAHRACCAESCVSRCRFPPTSRPARM
jgi:uncharacterized protein (TIGR03437 family)